MNLQERGLEWKHISVCKGYLVLQKMTNEKSKHKQPAKKCCIQFITHSESSDARIKCRNEIIAAINCICVLDNYRLRQCCILINFTKEKGKNFIQRHKHAIVQVMTEIMWI